MSVRAVFMRFHVGFRGFFPGLSWASVRVLWLVGLGGGLGLLRLGLKV